MAALAEILTPTPEGVDVKPTVYGENCAQSYQAESGKFVVVRGGLTTAEVFWERNNRQRIQPGEGPIEIKLLDGSTLRVTAVDNYQRSE